MTRKLHVILSALAATLILHLSAPAPLSAQTYYHSGLIVKSFTSSSAAVSWANNNLDQRQLDHMLILPVRIIDGPLNSNPPDVVTWIVTYQPSDNNSTDGMTSVDTATAPSVSWTSGLCGGSATAPYILDDYTSASGALTAYTDLTIHEQPFAGLLTHPENNSYKWSVIKPGTVAVHCQ